MAEIAQADGDPYRAFVCRTLNPFGYPAKDRSGRLDQIEDPHLGRLMGKYQRPRKTGERETGVWSPRLIARRYPRHARGSRSAGTMSGNWNDFNDAEEQRS